MKVSSFILDMVGTGFDLSQMNNLSIFTHETVADE